MKPVATVVSSGLHTTVQDLGRPGKRHLGVPLSGAADPVSLALANIALGNPASAGALECTMTGPALRLEQDTALSVAGADMSPTLNNTPIPLYQRTEGKAGDALALGAAKVGGRCYIAFEGGLIGENFLGSCSTYIPAAIGGVQGRTLTGDDALLSAACETSTPREIPRSLQMTLSHTFILRATTGPEAAAFADSGGGRFFASRWTVGRRADRMGVQLKGERLCQENIAPMASSPVFPGTVQCPSDGAPFVLLADAQTVGGYPRIAQIIAADLSLTGQLRPGDEVWFRKTTFDEARDIARKKAALFEGLLPADLFS